MEEKVGFPAGIRECMGASGADPATYSPLPLAYLGDAVYELYIRTYLCGKANMKPAVLTKKGSHMAMAVTQAAMVDILADFFTEEEQRLIQRGRNAKVGSIPSSCTAREYHKATGLEALIGGLYLKGDDERISMIIREGFDRLTGAGVI